MIVDKNTKIMDNDKGLGLSLREFINRNFKKLILLGFIFILFLLMLFINPTFFNFSNLMNLIQQISVLSMVSIGMTFVIISKCIDLSVGANLAIAGAIGVYVVNSTGNVFLGMMSSIVAGSSVGLLNGLMVGKFKINPFMATLATMVLIRGLTIWINDSNSVFVTNKLFLWIGQMYLGPFPAVLIPVLISFYLGHFFLQKSVFGKRTFAVGGDYITAKTVGINVERQIIYTFVLCGAIVGIASILSVGRTGSSQPGAGSGLEFEVITAVVIGGTSLRGGEGSMIGTILGVVIIGILANSLALLNIPAWYLNIFRGLVLIIAILADKASKYFRTTMKVS